MSGTEAFTDKALAAKRYEKLKEDRQPFLSAARDYSEITIPRLYPPEGSDSTKRHRRSSQTLGANGAKHLAAKILLSQFPPSTSFFRLYPNEEELAELGLDEDGIDDLKALLDQATEAVTRSLESGPWRSQLAEAILHLIVGGNALVFDFDTQTTKVYSLDNYVCRRASNGDLVEAVIEEKMLLSEFEDDKEAFDALEKALKDSGSADEGLREKEIDVYTHVKLHQGKHHWRMEALDIEIPGSRSSVNAKQSPWYALRWAEDGSDYGRAMIEDVYADLLDLASVKKGVVDWAAAATKVIWFQRLGSATDSRLVAGAESGEIVMGDREDFEPLHVPSLPNAEWLRSVSAEIAQDLQRAFLMNTSIQRDGERVTAEEIRYMAQEIETVHGGLYTVLANELQRPMVRNRLRMLQAEGKLLGGEAMADLEPTITTGVEALAKGAAYERATGWYADMASLIGPERTARFVDDEKLLRLTADARAFDFAKVAKSPEKMQQEAEQERAALMQQAALGPVVQEGAKAAFSQPNNPPQ